MWSRAAKVRWVIPIAISLGLGLAPSSAQAPAGAFEDRREVADSPAGLRLKEFVAAVNQPTSEGLREFVNSAFAPSYGRDMTPEQHLEWFEGVKAASGQFELFGERIIERNPMPGSVIGIVHAVRTDAWLGVMIGVEPQPPHRITSLMINHARPPKETVETTPLDAAALAEELAQYVSSLAARDAFWGAVLLAVDDRVLLSKAWGPENRERATANTTRTRFGLSSTGKTFTAVAIARLVDAGKLQFDDLVWKYLGSAWLPEDAKEKLTIRHLLNHTGGTGDFLGALMESDQHRKPRRVADYKPLVRQLKLRFEPGTQFEYSNSGFVLLGAVIEQVSGKEYEQFLREQVWGPAGMRDTACLDRQAKPQRFAIGYYHDTTAKSEGWQANSSLTAGKGSPAGGCCATAEDLYRFARALQSGKLVRPTTLESLWSEQSPPGSAMRYGLGFTIEGTAQDRIVGHGGTFPGANTAFDIYRDRGVVVVVLANGDGIGAVRSRSQQLISRLSRKPGR